MDTNASQGGYIVSKEYIGQPEPLRVTISFSLSYRGWLKLEVSDVWKKLEEQLEYFQKE